MMMVDMEKAAAVTAVRGLLRVINMAILTLYTYRAAEIWQHFSPLEKMAKKCPSQCIPKQIEPGSEPGLPTAVATAT